MCYFSHAFQYPQATVDAICHALNNPKFDRVDFIVGRGVSGLMTLLPVSIQSGIRCSAVRKSVDTEMSACDGGSHSGSAVETYLPPGERVNRYVIIDDLIESGNTVEQVIQTMTTTYTHSQCVGVILYQHESPVDDQLEKWNGVPVESGLTHDVEEIDKLTRGSI